MSRAGVLVAGGGAVGLAFAAAGRDPCVVLERENCRPANDPKETDLRVYALSPGTQGFLTRLGAWQRLPAERIAPVATMAVFGDDGGRLHFPSRRGEPVAWIVEGNRIVRAVEEAAIARGVDVRHRAAIASVSASGEGVACELADGSTVEAALLVGADGPASAVRGLLGLASEAKSYSQLAVVAHFACERPHGGVARQWFQRGGVLAWLPLPGSRISIVWSAPEALANELLALDPVALAARVRDSGGSVLGDLQCEAGPTGFPLRLVRVPRIAVPGAVLLGDAAHGVHPLAGQGLNLGLQDAQSLASALAARSALERPGDLAVLRRHERARRGDVDAMQFMTDELNGLFAAEGLLPRRLRNSGLSLLDGLPPLRDALAARAMR